MSKDRPYWFFEWLKKEKIRDLQQLEDALDKPRGIRNIRKMAEDWSDTSINEDVGEGSILAGAGLDMAFNIDCPSYECRRSQVDLLFRRAWFYFDRIVVSDTVGEALREHYDELGPEDIRERLLSVGSALLHIRELGAENLIDFREKFDPPQIKPTKGYKNTKKYKDFVNQHEQWLELMLNEGEFLIRETRGGNPIMEYRHPDVPADTMAVVPDQLRDKGYPEIRKWFVAMALQRHLEMIGTDIYSANKYKSPLALGVGLHGRLRNSMQRPSEPATVAMSLTMPYLDGLPIKELLALRNTEKEDFLRFRSALRKAIMEGVKNSPSLGPHELARQIEGDVLEPAISKISDRLRAAESVLAKKAGYSVSFGALATICGLLTDMQSLTIGAALGLATVGATAIGKRKEEQRDIELEDMYFLWKVAGHANH